MFRLPAISGFVNVAHGTRYIVAIVGIDMINPQTALCISKEY